MSTLRSMSGHRRVQSRCHGCNYQGLDCHFIFDLELLLVIGLVPVVKNMGKRALNS
jgi:hypothetical protein